MSMFGVTRWLLTVFSTHVGSPASLSPAPVVFVPGGTPPVFVPPVVGGSDPPVVFGVLPFPPVGDVDGSSPGIVAPESLVPQPSNPTTSVGSTQSLCFMTNRLSTELASARKITVNEWIKC
jgi:hypothetical protein